MTVTSATTCWGDSLYNLIVTMAEQYRSVCVCVCVCVCVGDAGADWKLGDDELEHNCNRPGKK